MSIRLAYTFDTDDSMKYPGTEYIVLETETPEQQRPFAALIVGLSKNGAVNFAFDYLAEEFENGTTFNGVPKESQVSKWGYRKAAEFSLLPKKNAPSGHELQELYVKSIIDSVADLKFPDEVIAVMETHLRDRMPDGAGLKAIWEAAR